MATDRSTDAPPSKGNSDSLIEQSARAVSELIESGATVMGRGLAAGVQGMAQLTERAAEMTGVTPGAIAKAADRAAASTASASRSAVRTTQKAGRSTARLAKRTVARTTRAAKRVTSTAARAVKRKPASTRAVKRTPRPASKVSAQKGRRKVSQSRSMPSKRTGPKRDRGRKRS